MWLEGFVGRVFPVLAGEQALQNLRTPCGEQSPGSCECGGSQDKCCKTTKNEEVRLVLLHHFLSFYTTSCLATSLPLLLCLLASLALLLCVYTSLPLLL